jgi:hypothetical protein
MIDQYKKVGFALFNGMIFNQSVNFIKFGASPPLSRAQIHFLMLCFTSGLTFLKPSDFTNMGMGRDVCHYYLNILIESGYINKVRFGTYQLTESAFQLINDFQQEYNRRVSSPLSWK